MSSHPRLIARLIEVADKEGDALTLLHERVVLERLDGSRVAGRLRVADAIRSRGSGARLKIIWEHDAQEVVHVALSSPDLPGAVVFSVRGQVHPTVGTLTRIWMETLGE